jgi:hypothetical protein
MSKKLEKNGLWESSRMMLPQHKEAALRQKMESLRIPRPTLDYQEIESISATLNQSQIYKKYIEITLYDEYQSRTLVGIVTQHQRNSFRMDTMINGSEDWEWIDFADVLKAELSTEWTEEEMQDL